MFVVTIDQRSSRVVGDRVPELLGLLGPGFVAGGAARDEGVRLGIERTVGDEVQAVLDDPALVVGLAMRVLRIGGWSIGIGAGPVDEPLPTSTREGSGPAFILARTAVEAAKSRQRSVPLAVRGYDDTAGRDAEAVLVLAAAVAARRSAQGWEVVDALADDDRQEDVASRLGISQQAVSKRLRASLWPEEQQAHRAAAHLLAAAQ